MNRLSKVHFWEWFKNHHTEYIGMNKKSKKHVRYWMNELNAHLRAYYKFFGFTLALDEKGTNKLTITVNGKAVHFKKAEALVAAAPAIEGWQFVALDEPMPVDFMLDEQIKEAGISPQEFSFSFADDDPQSGDIILYHPLCTEENEHIFLRLAEAAIYNLLGERSFAMDIQSVYLCNLSLAEPGHELLMLEELPSRLGLMISSTMVVDKSGRLVNI
jgi:hypothetical protein